MLESPNEPRVAGDTHCTYAIGRLGITQGSLFNGTAKPSFFPRDRQRLFF
jgi:hypothetical protein